jgi:hypothetical protein
LMGTIRHDEQLDMHGSIIRRPLSLRLGHYGAR